MAHDGLLPQIFARVHSRTQTPWISTIIIGICRKIYRFDQRSMFDRFRFLGVICAIVAAIFPLSVLGEMTSIGTLVAFFLVHLSVMIVSHFTRLT